ncbi:hypothetical protein FACS189432_09320 [Bacteroidia bacterium]|nr:hypothetical protein FACS189432_09320 [Bacteroidia bacterium]GHV71812.1 hypothetical protein FACS189420_8050 [Bacteroidia bacterium]
MPFSLHLSTQLKQATQRELSTSFSLLLIHCDLQAFSHNPQPVHWLSSKTTLKIENLEINPNKEPTGQMELQNNRPRKKDKIPTAKKATNEIISEMVVTE